MYTVCINIIRTLQDNMIESVSHITFVVRDVEKMGFILQVIFDSEECYDSTEKNYSLSYEKLFIVGGTWVAVMKGESPSERYHNHAASISLLSPEIIFGQRIKRLQLILGKTSKKCESLFK